MEKRLYNGKSVEECLKRASEELGLPVKDIKYHVEYEKSKGFFKKAEITVFLPEVEEESHKSMATGKARVEDGKLIIIDGEEEYSVTIIKGENIRITVDGEEVISKTSVNSNSKIDIEFNETIASRSIDLNISENRMEVYLSIEYKPEIIYGLKDVQETNTITLEGIVKGEKYPPKYTKAEIIELLYSKGVTYGINEEVIDSLCNKKSIIDVLVASGDSPIHPEDDKIEIYFLRDGIKEYKVDTNGNMDFKSIGHVSSVKKGDVLAKRILGKEGIEGKNVLGQAVKVKRKKYKEIIAKEGCTFTDSNTVVATIDGRPEMKGAILSINTCFELNGDVDIKSGNIDFIGDVIIYGDIKDGMEVKTGNNLIVKGSTSRCKIECGGDVDIDGNIISSSIKSHNYFYTLSKYLENLRIINEDISNIYNMCKQLRNSKTVKVNVSDGDIVRLVIESKFKGFRKNCIALIEYMNNLNDVQCELYTVIKSNFIPKNMINIDDIEELKNIKEIIKNKIDSITEISNITSTINMSYVQDSNVECSGTINITGKGVYKSNVYATEGIYFTSPGHSNVRGGKIIADKEIKAKTIGANTGVMTTVGVGKQGHIYCDVAYLNTKFIVGEKEQILDESCKNVHVYLDKIGDLVIDKFKL